MCVCVCPCIFFLTLFYVVWLYGRLCISVMESKTFVSDVWLGGVAIPLSALQHNVVITQPFDVSGDNDKRCIQLHTLHTRTYYNYILFLTHRGISTLSYYSRCRLFLSRHSSYQLSLSLSTHKLSTHHQHIINTSSAHKGKS